MQTRRDIETDGQERNICTVQYQLYPGIDMIQK
jgi:hypothetical protein